MELAMAGENGKNMTMQQFLEVTLYIQQNHGFGRKGHHIKYIRPHFDTRTGDFYGVSLSGIFGHKDFFVTNENRHRDLTAWIMEFLQTDPKAAVWDKKVSETG
jgi:hypothetical protein